jgi:hypothetical protein
LLLRDDLGDEAAEREAEEIDFAKTRAPMNATAS